MPRLGGAGPRMAKPLGVGGVGGVRGGMARMIVHADGSIGRPPLAWDDGAVPERFVFDARSPHAHTPVRPRTDAEWSRLLQAGEELRAMATIDQAVARLVEVRKRKPAP